MAIRTVTPQGQFSSGFVHRWPSGTPRRRCERVARGGRAFGRTGKGVAWNRRGRRGRQTTLAHSAGGCTRRTGLTRVGPGRLLASCALCYVRGNYVANHVFGDITPFLTKLRRALAQQIVGVIELALMLIGARFCRVASSFGSRPRHNPQHSQARLQNSARGRPPLGAGSAQGGDVLDVSATYMHVYYAALGDGFAGIWERI
jgi:hypothetical protein